MENVLACITPVSDGQFRWVLAFPAGDKTQRFIPDVDRAQIPAKIWNRRFTIEPSLHQLSDIPIHIVSDLGEIIKFIGGQSGGMAVIGDAQFIPLINDRVDVALAVDADGVHLGQDDMNLSDARRLLGPEKIIGISASSLQEAILAEKEGADYIGISPVFSTTTKPDVAPPLGLEGVRQIRNTVNIPIVGIGGINIQNCRDVISSGADGTKCVVTLPLCSDSQLKT